LAGFAWTGEGIGFDSTIFKTIPSRGGYVFLYRDDGCHVAPATWA
jgi:hypothetical protein